MLYIIFYNPGLWINLAIPFAIGIYLIISHREYVLKEFAIQMGATLTILALMYSILFTTTTDLIDKEHINGYVTKFTHWEEWTERVEYWDEVCSGSGESRTCTSVLKVRYDFHPEYWTLNSSTGEEIRISYSKYRNAVYKFGKKFESVWRADRSSYGDGNKYVSRPNITIPVATTNTYSNYVMATRNLFKHEISEYEIETLVKDRKLLPYPNSYKGYYGEPRLDRVIDTTGMLDKRNLREGLDLMSASLGSIKQVNPVIYGTNEGMGFKRLLGGYWKGGKKNDATLILGIDSNGKIIWSDVITYTNNTDFIIDCQNKFKGLNAKDTDKILATFRTLINTQYVRKPMEEFNYLRENISLEWYWQFMVIIINMIASFFVFRHTLNNYVR